MEKLKVYFLYLFTALALVLAWYLLLYKNFITNQDQKIIILFTSFGLILSFSQFLFTNIKHQNDIIFKLRYEEYCNFISLFNKLTNTINEGAREDINPNITTNKIMNIQNEISVLVLTTSHWIFPKLVESKPSQELSKLTQKIFELTNAFSNEYFQIKLKFPDSKNQTLEKESERMRWHNLVSQEVKKIHKFKYELFILIQNYLK